MRQITPGNALASADIDAMHSSAGKIRRASGLRRHNRQQQQQMPGRAAEIADEWRLNTKTAIEAQLPALARFLVRPEYGLIPERD